MRAFVVGWDKRLVSSNAVAFCQLFFWARLRDFSLTVSRFLGIVFHLSNHTLSSIKSSSMWRWAIIIPQEGKTAADRFKSTLLNKTNHHPIEYWEIPESANTYLNHEPRVVYKDQSKNQNILLTTSVGLNGQQADVNITADYPAQHDEVQTRRSSDPTSPAA